MSVYVCLLFIQSITYRTRRPRVKLFLQSDLFDAVVVNILCCVVGSFFDFNDIRVVCVVFIMCDVLTNYTFLIYLQYNICMLTYYNISDAVCLPVKVPKKLLIIFDFTEKQSDLNNKIFPKRNI